MRRVMGQLGRRTEENTVPRHPWWNGAGCAWRRTITSAAVSLCSAVIMQSSYLRIKYCTSSEHFIEIQLFLISEKFSRISR